MRLKTLLMAALVLLSACGDAAGPDDGGGIDNFTAKIDGVSWSPQLQVTAINGAAGIYSITAIKATGSNPFTMVFALYNITGPGTFPLGVVPNVFGGTVNLSSPPSNGWSTPLNGTAGEIKITTLTATKMVAEFKFDTQPLLAGSPGAPKVTEGKMDIAVSGTGGFAPPNQGNRVTGDIGGTFAAGSATGSVTSGLSGPVLTVVASNGTRNLTLSIANMTGLGTYPLSSALSRTIQVGGTPGNLLAGWGSQSAGGSGQVLVTGFSTSRVAGSFTATLVPVSGGATGSLTVSGNFDIARQF